MSGLVDDESCNDNVEDELVLVMEDTPGTTRGTKLSVLHINFLRFLVNGGS